MAAPNLTVTVEPAEGSAVVYGLLAPRTSNDPPNGQLSLVLTIKNLEPSAVHLNQVTVSFTGPPSVAAAVIAADVTIQSNQTQQWYFPTANNIILPVPAPGAITLDLACDGFSDSATLSKSLAQYVSPAQGGTGYAFPASSVDLKEGEFWSGRSAVHGEAGGGTQLFAYDLGVRAYDSSSDSWPTRPAGSDATKNDSYYVWGKPILAIADGVVKQIRDGMPANTPPSIPDPAPSPVEGNYFYIQHASDLALYAHLQAGTLNPALTSGPNPDGTGATVTKGQLLGLAGNSGRSSEPHLHIQVNRTTIPWGGPPRPLSFDTIPMLDMSVTAPYTWPPNTDSPWSVVPGSAVPSVLSAIWRGQLGIGRNIFGRWIAGLAWAWIIIIGGLMITPGGVDCIVCGPVLTRVLGVVSIALGILGVVSGALVSRTKPRFTPPQVDAKGDARLTHARAQPAGARTTGFPLLHPQQRSLPMPPE